MATNNAVNLNQLKQSVFNMKNYVDYNSKNAYNKKAMGIFDITLDENGVITNTANATSYYVKTTNNQHYLTWSKDDFPIKSDGYVLMKIDIDGEYNFNTHLMKIDTYTSRSFVGNIKLDNNTFVFQIATKFNQKYTYNQEDGKGVSESKENTQSMVFMFNGKDGKLINRTIHLEYYYYEDNSDTFVQFPGLKGVNRSITYMENDSIIGDNSINLSNYPSPDYSFIIGGNSRNAFNNGCSYGSVIGYGNNLNKINYYNIIGVNNTVEGKLNASYNEYFINIMGQYNTYKADASTINYKPVSILGNYINACNSGLYIGMGGTFEKDDIMGIANGTSKKENIIFKVKRDGRVKASIPTENDDLTTKKYVDDKIAGLVNSAPETLDTLNELATALGNDANFATTMTTTLGNKVDKVDGKALSTNDLTNELKANYDAAYTHSQSVHFDGDYNSLANIPTDLVKTTDADSKYASIDSPNFINAISMGRKADTTIGTNSIVLGNESQAIGNYSHAEGYKTTALGEYSTSKGYSANLATDIIENLSVETSNDDILAGKNTAFFNLSKGKGSSSEGYSTLALGDYSHVEGYNSVAIGKGSHSEGGSSTASSTFAHAEGSMTTASGKYSHAEGFKTQSKGESSHAEGYGTIANSRQHVQGKYNIEDTENKYTHIVGNGPSDTARSNAHTLDWSGNAWYKGSVYTGGTGQDDANAKKLATEDYVNRNKVSKTSELTNDSGFLTDIPSDYITETELTAKGYIDNATLFMRNSSKNLVDESALLPGYINENDRVMESSTYVYTPDYIRVTPNKHLVATWKYLTSDTRAPSAMRFISCYNENFEYLKDLSSSTEVNTFLVPNGVEYVKVTFYASSTNKLMLELNDTSASSGTYTPFEGSLVVRDNYLVNYARKDIMEPRLALLESAINTELIELDQWTTRTSDNLSTNPITIDPSSNIAANKIMVFSAQIGSSFESLTLGHGETSYGSTYITIDDTNVTVYEYYSSLQTYKTYAHGLTISDFIDVVIETNSKEEAVVAISTSSGMNRTNVMRWIGCNGNIFAKCTNSELTNCSLRWTCKNFDKDIQIYGDSYASMYSNRFVYRLVEWGYDSFLLDAYSGRSSAAAYDSLVLNLQHSHPKYIVWTLGMNDPDSNTAINSNWQTAVENVMTLCREKDIELILCTIPNVRGGAVDDTDISSARNHNFKNNYVRNSGHRYIDFSLAVGAEESNSWYPNMLYTDGVHPAELGATALASRFVQDFPEIALGVDSSEAIYDDTQVKASISEIKEKINGNIEPINTTFFTTDSTKNLVNEEVLQSGYISNNGTVYSNSSYVYTDYFRVTPGKYIVATWLNPNNSVRYTTSMRFIAIYDSNKNVVSDLGSSAGTNKFLVPSGAAYARVTLPSNNVNKVMVELTDDGNPSGKYESFEGKSVIKEEYIPSSYATKKYVDDKVAGDITTHTNDKAVAATIDGTDIVLSTNKYQYVKDISGNSSQSTLIWLPYNNLPEFCKIHLYIINSSLTMLFDTAIAWKDHQITDNQFTPDANNIYEIILTYINSTWIGEFNIYYK